MARKSPGRHRQNPVYLRHLMGACDRGECVYCLAIDLGLTVAARGSTSPLAILAELMRGRLAAALPVSAELIDALDELVPGWRAGEPAPVIPAAGPAVGDGIAGALVELPAPRLGPAPRAELGDDRAYEDPPIPERGMEFDRELAVEGLREPVGGPYATTFAQRFEHLTRQVRPPDVAWESGGPPAAATPTEPEAQVQTATILDQAAADERVIVALWSENNGREADRIGAIAARGREAQRRARQKIARQELRAVR